MGLEWFLVIFFAMLSVLCLIGAIISLLMPRTRILRLIISLILFAGCILFAILTFGIVVLWTLLRIITI